MKKVIDIIFNSKRDCDYFIDLFMYECNLKNITVHLVDNWRRLPFFPPHIIQGSTSLRVGFSAFPTLKFNGREMEGSWVY